jgi:lipopolysaccharide biosynthesis glycosyltransferase
MKVFIGYDSRETEAYDVAVRSILRYNKTLEVRPIVKSHMKAYGFDREDSKGSTEFTLTRFLTPYLAAYEGYALFMDCDVLVQTDLESILQEADLSKAVSCVQHDYTPKSNFKMDKQIQHVYPRKNWSSVMLFNCSHPLIKKNLTLGSVCEESPKYLHRMEWAEDSVGSLHHTWNYLSGYYTDLEVPNIIHYTDGGPWFDKYKHCQFAEEWRRAQNTS